MLQLVRLSKNKTGGVFFVWFFFVKKWKRFEALLPKWLRQEFDLPTACCEIGRSCAGTDRFFVQSPAQVFLESVWKVCESVVGKGPFLQQFLKMTSQMTCVTNKSATSGYDWKQPLEKTLQFKFYAAKHDDWYINAGYNHSKLLRNNFMC